MNVPTSYRLHCISLKTHKPLFFLTTFKEKDFVIRAYTHIKFSVLRNVKIPDGERILPIRISTRVFFIY